MTHISKTELLTTVDRKWLLEFFAPEGRARPRTCHARRSMDERIGRGH